MVNQLFVFVLCVVIILVFLYNTDLGQELLSTFRGVTVEEGFKCPYAKANYDEEQGGGSNQSSTEPVGMDMNDLYPYDQKSTLI